jgi:membrane dipeptidase
MDDRRSCAAAGQAVALSTGVTALGWHDLAAGADAAVVDIDGFAATAAALTAGHFILLAEPACCAGCVPRNPMAAVEVFARSPVPLRGQALRLTGTWRVVGGAPSGYCYQIHDARLREPPGWRAVTRRGVLAAGPMMCLAARSTVAQPGSNDARRAIASVTTVDLHSHAGGIANVSRVRSGEAFAPVAAPMRQGGMAAICLAIVSDGPTHRVMTDGRIHPYREPAPGELYQYAQLAFGRVHGMARDQGLAVIAGASGLVAAKSGAPSAIIAAEGADFLEGQIERVDEAFSRWSLRHLQLTHYRVNELGDIQTEPPVHDGLTDFGADVVRHCNKLGIVVDVAHGTYELVRRAASVATRPLVLSHTSLRTRTVPFTRRITAEHARVIASTGGVIGVWPPASEFDSLTAMATGIARLVDVVGIEHVGLGSDMRGLVGNSVFPEYDRLPGLAEALVSVGFGPTETGMILGGNYTRVFHACVG